MFRSSSATSLRYLAIFASLGAFSGSSACYTKPSTQGLPCEVDSHCDAGQVCGAENVCVPEGEGETAGDEDESGSAGDGDGDGSGSAEAGDGDETSTDAGSSETGNESGTTADGDSSSSTGDGDGDSSTGTEDGSTSAGDGDSSTGAGDGDGDGSTTTGDGDGDGSTGDGDGDGSTGSGDGDGDGSTGDGDGDGSTGDGDGDGSTGDGDGDGSTGDGDGDGSTGDGDGDGSTGDGDGDGSTGDGDGDGSTGGGDGDGSTGDGDGDGDGSTGDGDGDGDGSAGDGDGDGSAGDGDGDGDGTTGGPACGPDTDFIADPEFQDADAWDATGTSSVQVSYDGNFGPGAGVTTLGNGSLSTPYCLPEPNEGQRMRVDLWMRTALPVQLLLDGVAKVPSAGARQSTNANTWLSRGWCVAESDWSPNGSKALRIDTQAGGGDGDEVPVDDVTLVSADECALPGEVRGGDFESDPSYWYSGSSQNALAPHFDADVGSNGLRIGRGNNCGSLPGAVTSAYGNFQIESSMANPALRFDIYDIGSTSAVTGIQARVGSTGDQLDSVWSSLVSDLETTGTTETVCLPAGSAGKAGVIHFYLSGGGCSDGINDILIDNVTLVDGC